MIPQECEDDLFEHIDGFVEGNGAFGKIAALALAEKTPLSEHPALAAMFESKWKNPEAYWRDYEKWYVHEKSEEYNKRAAQRWQVRSPSTTERGAVPEFGL